MIIMFRRKSIERTISMFLGIVIVFSFSGIAFASEASLIDDTLVSRGFPVAVVRSLKDEVKENLYTYGDTFDSATLQYYNENTNQSTSYEFTETKQPIMPRGQIQTAHLSLTWIVTRVSGGKRITFNYDWKTLPLNRWQDPVGVSWNPAIYELRGGSFRKVDKYVYHIGASSTAYTGTQSDESAFANASSSGVTWYADLKGLSSSMPVTELYGYGEFILNEKASGGSYIYSNYVHKKIVGSLSMTIPNFGSFSVSGGASYDELGSQQYVSP